ncbi:glycosyltransferase family 39 protein, partial [Myxococcota bacterium]|nr:glycosyltransferase family 39 protein [Myxococcota bacterium]
MSDSDRRRRLLAVAGLIGLATGALLIRALGFEYVFVGEEVVFPPADPQYHLRRAFFTMTQFPDVLLFDPYINFPGGAPVPWPPLFDWLLGAAGWLAGGTTSDLERAAAWAAPVCAAMVVWPLYFAGRLLSSRRVGLLAGLFFALLPISVVYTRVGNADHHAAVTLVGAWLLYCLLALVDPAASRARMIGLAGLLALLSAIMLLTWHGSLLYLAPAEGLLLLAAILSGRSRLLAAQA